MNKVRFWAFVYRLTGFTHRCIVEDELDFITDNLNKFYCKYQKKPQDYRADISFKDYVSIEIGMRQVGLKLYRKWKMPLRCRIKRWLKND